ncbi:hypothetical protein RZS08_40370, partial [Arthrospira platensis SPKY1]|nr:hypothetical protein [Arthrospira platensis SPKY1]
MVLDAVEGELTVVATIDPDNAGLLDVSGTSEDVPAGGEVTITITSENGGVPVVVTTSVDGDGNYSLSGVDVSGLVDGELTIVATATDNNG